MGCTFGTTWLFEREQTHHPKTTRHFLCHILCLYSRRGGAPSESTTKLWSWAGVLDLDVLALAWLASQETGSWIQPLL